MSVQILPFDLKDRSQVRKFLELPFRLYRDIPQWVPPLGDDERSKLSQKHPFYQHSQAAFFLACQANGDVIGRLAVLENSRYNNYNQEQTAFFTLFECAASTEAAQGLFSAAGDWAVGRGMKRMLGPKGFTALDGLGLLAQGFEHPAAFGIPYNLPYYPELLETCGFSPSGDILSGYLSGNLQLPEKVHQVAERVQQRRGLRVKSFRSRRELRELVPALESMYNRAIEDMPGNVPLTRAEVQSIANQLLWFADPRLIKLIYKGDQPVGFLLAYPDVSAAVQRHRGKLFPFGWLDLLLELKRTNRVDINGAGIIEEYRGLGGTALLFSEMQKSIAARGAPLVEVIQIGADNQRMLNELRQMGVDFCKIHRMYEKSL